MKLSNLRNNYYYSNYCLVCGYDVRKDKVNFPDRDTIGMYDHEYCPCCGAQVAYTYSYKTGHGVKVYRQHWAEELKYVFDDEDLIPEGWNKEMALKQIQENVPEEFQ